MASLNEILAAVGIVTKKVEALTPASPDASALSEIASLKASLSTVTGERDALANEIAGLKSANAAAVADLSKALDERNAFEAKVKDLEAKQESAEKKAANIVAGLGVPALPEAKGSTGKSVTRAEFSSWSARAQSDYCKTGGRITD